MSEPQASSPECRAANRAPVSVVTVTYNNVQGLLATLDSLRPLRTGPAEVVVIDGGSSDSTVDVLRSYTEQSFALRYVSEPDDGIYAAMNKGRRLASQRLIHYLNAGDIVLGEPYEGVSGPVRLPAELLTPDGRGSWQDFIKLGGFGYCHQGLVFPASHPDYDTRYRLAGDFDLIMRSFPNGLHELPLAPGGGVRYHLGGVSSQQWVRLDRELIAIAIRNRGLVTAGSILAVVIGRHLLPRSLRRLAAQLFLQARGR